MGRHFLDLADARTLPTPGLVATHCWRRHSHSVARRTLTFGLWRNLRE
jgi:hypothetical protein